MLSTLLVAIALCATPAAVAYTLTIHNQTTADQPYYVSYGGWCKHDQGTVSANSSVPVNEDGCCTAWVQVGSTCITNISCGTNDIYWNSNGLSASDSNSYPCTGSQGTSL